MTTLKIRRGRPTATLLGLFGLILLAGCGRSFHAAPVSGTVTQDGQPLDGGVLTFVPDAAKGNTARVNGVSPIRAGGFALQSSGVTPSESGPGIPPGWYKVLVITDPIKASVKVSNDYANIEKTPLSVEVVDSPAPLAPLCAPPRPDAPTTPFCPFGHRLILLNRKARHRVPGNDGVARSWKYARHRRIGKVSFRPFLAGRSPEA